MWIADTDRAEVLCFAFSPDGATLYTGDDEGAVVAWDRATQEGRELFRAPPDALRRPVPVWQVAPSPCGTRLFVPVNRRVHVLDAGTGKPARKSIGPLVEDGLRMSLSPDGTQFLAPTPAHVAACWDVETGERLPLPGRLAKSAGWHHAEYLPGGATILTVSMTGASARLWDARTGDELAAWAPKNCGAILWATSADGSAFAIVGPASHFSQAAREVWVFDLGTREQRAMIRTEKAVKDLAFHPAGRTLATADGTRGVTTWDTRTGAKIGGGFYPKIGNVGVVALAPDGLTCCAGGVGRFAVFDVNP